MVISYRDFLLNESTIIVYRGLTQKYSPKYEKEIIWVSTSKEHAEMYSDKKSGEILEYKINLSKLKPLNLGFRSVETEVKIDEIKGRLNTALMSQFESNKISNSSATRLADEIDKLSHSGYSQVWEYVHKSDILRIIRQMNFNAIQQNEGLLKFKGDIITYGILDKSLLSK